jgi:hypothetical protein
MVSGYNASTLGVQTLTVTHEENTLTFDVEVHPPLANRIAAATGSTTITLYYDESLAPITLNGNKDITLVGDGSERTIRLSASGILFAVTDNAKLTLGNNVSLKGLGFDISNGGNSLILITGNGVLTMEEGSKLSDNWKNADFGSAIFLQGTSTTLANVIMNGGSIVNNKVNNYGIVYTEVGTFTMNGGTISDNVSTSPSSHRGGGMYIAANGVFNMIDGLITRNDNGRGGGVHNRGVLNLTGGTITDNISRLNLNDLYIRADAGTITNISGSPVTKIALEVNSSIFQNGGFSGDITIDLCGSLSDWTGKTIVAKGEGYQGTYGNFKLGSFIDDSTGAKTPISGTIGADGKLN